MGSILTTVKSMLGIQEEYTHFDQELIVHINSALAILYQLGIGPTAGFSISGSGETWEDFMGEDPRINFVKTYVWNRVRLLFDPPSSSTLVDAINASIQEFEWRATNYTDTDKE